jgi:hypothetical protein
MKIRPLVAGLFYSDRLGRQMDGRTDRWTNILKLTAACRNFAKAPKMVAGKEVFRAVYVFKFAIN